MEFNKELVRGTVEPIVLRLLSGGEMYGYEIVKVVNERTGGRFEWREGSLYPCLHRLDADGMLKSVWREAPNGKARKYYRVTRRGRAALARRTAEWTEFAHTVNALLSVQPA